MSDYIKRDNAINISNNDKYIDLESGLINPEILREAIYSLPTEDVKPIIRGRWKFNNDGSGTCSVCNTKQINIQNNINNFCSFCGADMRNPINNKI